MRYLAFIVALAAAVSLPVANAALLQFNAYDSNGCAGNPLETHLIDTAGTHSASFVTGYKSFWLLATDEDCELLTWTNKDFTGTKDSFFGGVAPDACAGTTNNFVWNSFDVHCN